jgi:hypothetical protein
MSQYPVYIVCSLHEPPYTLRAKVTSLPFAGYREAHLDWNERRGACGFPCVPTRVRCVRTSPCVACVHFLTRTLRTHEVRSRREPPLKRVSWEWVACAAPSHTLLVDVPDVPVETYAHALGLIKKKKRKALSGLLVSAAPTNPP